MYIKREISLLPDTQPFLFDYNNQTYDLGDTAVVVYTDYKISLLMTDGMAAVVGNNVYTIMRGDILIFRPEEIHFGRILRAGVHRFLDFWIPANLFSSFCGGCDDFMRPFFDRTAGRINLITPDDDSRGRLLRLGEELAALAGGLPESSVSPTTDALIFAKLLELLSLCRRLYEVQKLHPSMTVAPELVTKTIRRLNEDFPRFVGLDELAEEMGCSVTCLTRVFRLHTGKSIHGYLTERRLENAGRLLASGATVTEACFESGYGDCSGFIKAFRAYRGMTPGQYRRNAAPSEMESDEEP